MLIDQSTVKKASLLACGAMFGMLGVLSPNAIAQDDFDKGFTKDFDIENREFCDVGRNTYFVLEPGYRMLLEGEEDEEEITLLITVLNQTRDVKIQTEDGPRIVITRIVEEREWIDGELYEVSKNFFARCMETDDIFYFGEKVDFYENGEIVDHHGSWRAGRRGATAGIHMPGSFLLGARYYQEVAVPLAADRAEHKAMGVTQRVPAGKFEDCVVMEESSGLDPDEKEYKVYAPGIGLIKDGPLELVAYGQLDDEEGECGQ